MTFKIVYWDSAAGAQRERDATPEEVAQREADIAAAAIAAVPAEVTRRQGLEALFDMYQLKDTDIEAAIVQHVTDPAAQYKALNEFKTSQVFERERPLVVLMCQVLNLDRPALFTYAKTL